MPFLHPQLSCHRVFHATAHHQEQHFAGRLPKVLHFPAVATAHHGSTQSFTPTASPRFKSFPCMTLNPTQVCAARCKSF